MADLDRSQQTTYPEPAVLEPIRLPEQPEPHAPAADEVIVVDPSLLIYLLFVFMLFVGAYVLGWGMATAPGQTIDAVKEAVATTVAGLPISRPSVTRAPLEDPFTSDPGLRFRDPAHQLDLGSLIGQVNPEKGYTLPVKYGKLGPQMLASGAIDYNRFVQTYQRAGQPLNDDQLAILSKGSDSPVVVDYQNAYFLLNFLWAVGLSNQNRILTEGPMMQFGADQVGSFASTGGWSLGAKPLPALYSHSGMIMLTPDQQTRLETVTAGVFRPCCQNPTLFPDCNHGMAMLGLLELMASQDATTDAMFTAAKQVNAFWFPQQMLELAMYFKAAQGLDLTQIELARVVGSDFFSSAGFRNVHAWLGQNGLAEQSASGGSQCGV
jgi:hypothetical protein